MTTEISKQVQQTAMSVYGQIANPIEFINEMGKTFSETEVCGAKSPAEGRLLALACMCENKHPFQVAREFHLIGGKLSMRSDAMLAKFRELGGEFTWLNIGDDGQAAEIKLSFRGNEIVSKYTIDDAKKANLVKSGGGWEKNPANMLRARAVSNGIRIVAPEVCAGVYTPEERDDIDSERKTQSTPSAAQVDARRQEILAAQQGNVVDSTDVPSSQPAAQTPSAEPQQAAPVAEAAPQASPSSAPAAAAAEAPPFEEPASVSPGTETPEQIALRNLEAVAAQAGATLEAIEKQLKASNANFQGLGSLTAAQVDAIRGNLEQKIAAARAAAGN